MSEYKIQARQFCRETGTRITILKSGEVYRFPGEDKPTGRRYKYRITLERNGQWYNTTFHDSVANHQTNDCPTPYDVLACMTKYDPGDFWDFVAEYGYEINGKESFERAQKVYTGCTAEYTAMKRLFGDVMDQLRDIQ